MTPTTILFDIETSGLPESELLDRMPDFQAPANYTNADKIREAIAVKKKAWLEDAALDALTGQVLCIGVSVDGEFQVLHGLEQDVISGFWLLITSAKELSGGALQLVGYNTHSFDLPFLIRRSWMLGVHVPRWIRPGRYFTELSIDLREVWQLGDRQASTGGLDGLCRSMGLGSKTGSGKDFGILWNSNRSAALAYIRNDILLTEKLAEKMGIITPSNKEQDELPL